MCVCVWYACISVCVHICVGYMYMWRPEVGGGCLPWLHTILYTEAGSPAEPRTLHFSHSGYLFCSKDPCLPPCPSRVLGLWVGFFCVSWGSQLWMYMPMVSSMCFTLCTLCAAHTQLTQEVYFMFPESITPSWETESVVPGLACSSSPTALHCADILT